MAFRADCPEGHLEKGRFAEIYGAMAPPGADVEHHVDQIFRIFDKDGRLGWVARTAWLRESFLLGEFPQPSLEESLAEFL